MSFFSFCFFSILVFFNLSASAQLKEATKQALIDNEANKNLSGPKAPCKERMSEREDPLKDLISYVCTKNQLTKKEINELNSKWGFYFNDIKLEDFVSMFNFFQENNKEIEKMNNEVFKFADLKLEKPSCHYQTRENSHFIINSKFSNLEFNGVVHLHEIKDPIIQRDYKLELNKRIKEGNPDAIILEGFEFGNKIDCKQGMMAIFTPEKYLNAEAMLLMKYALFHQIPIIPGDNQRIENNDKEIFYHQDKDKIKEVGRISEFMKILYIYGQSLDLNKAISKAKSSNFSNEKSFRDYYQELNHRELPRDQEEIYKDYKPIGFIKDKNEIRGTNLLLEKSDELRNKTLLHTLLISARKYKHPVAYFGSGHLAVLGELLAKNLGKSQDDFMNACHPDYH